MTIAFTSSNVDGTEYRVLNTVIFFFSDNGGYGPATDMAPLWGYKGNYYEGGIRVPAVIRWPGVLPAGKKLDQLTTVHDLFPPRASALGPRQPSPPRWPPARGPSASRLATRRSPLGTTRRPGSHCARAREHCPRSA